LWWGWPRDHDDPLSGAALLLLRGALTTTDTPGGADAPP
jgi:hypothetical protein